MSWSTHRKKIYSWTKQKYSEKFNNLLYMTGTNTVGETQLSRAFCRRNNSNSEQLNHDIFLSEAVNKNPISYSLRVE